MRFTSFVMSAFIGCVLSVAGCGDDDSSGDDAGGSSCTVSSDDCVDGCITSECGATVSVCSGDATCDAAKDTMVSCVCDAQRADDQAAVDACMATFMTQGGALAQSFASCATANCAAACGL
jgi:hypothetical protein